MKTIRRKKLSIGHILLVYLACGLAYSIAGFIYRGVIGKEEVFSPLLGIPMDTVSWPLMVYADLKNIGVLPQDIAVFVVLAVGIIAVVGKKK